ncbi:MULTISPECIES: class I SAM-dependent methyltransferase [Photorhabdus]|uniref:class I SAM-dependent methyltransferase n=1 Tax=Photorhabdus TaxID=29487 RepID=UPI000DCB829C|nr:MULTISPECIES: class I SAM-dependent methyltransferase [Photorhabdus]MCT8342242.1 class I SAM-dependent methyltransferase [Photorhabdus kleinii]RAW98450.1 SAM-dependent methyltransferase [Photorhabdus sp. S10-54]RAW98564.1 SAM-dependent methyltransferase [Photorhabdus sp. S9-53]RAX02765.1 SAM-dependent methyltransferase [Photorhabdus sp. S8-52]
MKAKNSKEFLQDVIEWDIYNWSHALKYWQDNSSLELKSANTLEIGSENGGLSLWAALNGANVLCTDLNGPTPKTLEKHKRYNIEDNIQYKKLSALDIKYKNHFDIVMFKSVLGSIGYNSNKTAQKEAINQIFHSLKEGGEFWFAENLVASPLHKFFRRNYIKWGNAWGYVTVNEMTDYLSAFSNVNYTTLGFLATFGRSESQRRFLGVLDNKVLNKIVPKHWHYIIIGVAKK